MTEGKEVRWNCSCRDCFYVNRRRLNSIIGICDTVVLCPDHEEAVLKGYLKEHEGPTPVTILNSWMLPMGIGFLKRQGKIVGTINFNTGKIWKVSDDAADSDAADEPRALRCTASTG